MQFISQKKWSKQGHLSNLPQKEEPDFGGTWNHQEPKELFINQKKKRTFSETQIQKSAKRSAHSSFHIRIADVAWQMIPIWEGTKCLHHF